MKKDSLRKSELTAYGIIVFNFLLVAVHSIAHEKLNVKATAAQMAFIVPVIIIAPVMAGFMLPKFKNAGAVLLTLSMTGSFFFGLYYHFIASTIDHVGHVATLESEFWAAVFIGTAFLMLLVEIPGAAVGGLLLVGQSPVFKNYAARTSI